MVKRSLTKFTSWLKKAPDRKHYIEFITATLSIPVLLTVILVNLNNLSQQNVKSISTTPTPSTVREVIIREQAPASKQEGQETNTKTASPTPTQNPECKKEIGPISIAYPTENQQVTDNPVNIIIKYEDRNYCSVVWSYRINGGQWSEYSNNAPAIYNMPSGAVKFELRVLSTTSNDQLLITRNFNYQGQSNPSITPTPTTQ